MGWLDRTCGECGTELSPHERFAGGLCGDWRCKERVAHREAERARADAGEQAGVEEAASYTIVPTPGPHERRLVAADLERQQKFARHLRVTCDAALRELATEVSEADVREAEAPPPDVDEAESGLTPRTGDATPASVLGAVCGACVGFCCGDGREHAFVESDDLVERARGAAEPAVALEQFAARVLEHLPAQSYEGGCVFQAEGGCALPRSLRSSTCNAYECRGLRTLRIALEGGAPSDRAAVVQRVDHRDALAVRFVRVDTGSVTTSVR